MNCCQAKSAAVRRLALSAPPAMSTGASDLMEMSAANSKAKYFIVINCNGTWILRVEQSLRRLELMARSVARVTVAACFSIAGLFAMIVLAVRQPTFGRASYRGRLRADPAALHRHVQFLTVNVRPRDAFHVANLD